MKKYELLLVLPGTLDEKEAENRSQEIVTLVKEHAGEVKVHPMGKNRLAYPVKQIRYGYFYTIVFEAEPTKVKELEGKLRLLRDVLRAMITYFNTDLTASQKIAYTTDSSGATVMVEKEFVAPVRPVAPAVPAFASAEEKEEVKIAPPRKSEKLNLDEINKKLDDLMSGDVI